MIEVRLEARNFYLSEETIQNVLNISEAVHSRHGIMVVGQPISGKTQSLRVFMDTMDKLHKREFNQQYVKFMLKKAERLEVEAKVIKKDG